jgi:hypothetical protein
MKEEIGVAGRQFECLSDARTPRAGRLRLEEVVNGNVNEDRQENWDL